MTDPAVVHQPLCVQHLASVLNLLATGMSNAQIVDLMTADRPPTPCVTRVSLSCSVPPIEGSRPMTTHRISDNPAQPIGFNASPVRIDEVFGWNGQDFGPRSSTPPPVPPTGPRALPWERAAQAGLAARDAEIEDTDERNEAWLNSLDEFTFPDPSSRFTELYMRTPGINPRQPS